MLTDPLSVLLLHSIEKANKSQTQTLEYNFFLIFINNLSVTKAVYPAKSQNHQLKISKLGFINKQVKTDLSIFTENCR